MDQQQLCGNGVKAVVRSDRQIEEEPVIRLVSTLFFFSLASM